MKLLCIIYGSKRAAFKTSQKPNNATSILDYYFANNYKKLL